MGEASAFRGTLHVTVVHSTNRFLDLSSEGRIMETATQCEVLHTEALIRSESLTLVYSTKNRGDGSLEGLSSGGTAPPEEANSSSELV